MDRDKQLKDRIQARKHELLAKYNDLKADSRGEAHEQSVKLKHKLDELELHLKDGWDKMSDAVRAKLDKWLQHDRDRD